MAKANTAEDFSQFVEPEPTTGCFLWSGAFHSNKLGYEYGCIKVRGVHYLAHRFAWRLRHGSLPPDLFVLHRCDVTWCVNPDHLFLGTHQDNMADMARKGRAVSVLALKTHCPYGHAYDAANTMRRQLGPWQTRQCRTCHRRRDAERLTQNPHLREQARLRSAAWRLKNPKHPVSSACTQFLRDK